MSGTTRPRAKARPVLVALVALVALALAACQADDDGGLVAPPGSGSEPELEAAAGELPTDVRSVPDPLPGGEPGDLVALAERSTPEVPADARAWDVLHLSEGVDGRPTAVSGVVYAPGGMAPEEGRPVLSWGHGTVGLADDCAPSRAGVVVPGLAELLDAGYVVAATDYEGLGTPGPHPYLVGVSAGRSVLDAARAAGRIDGAGAGDRVVVAGHSQGGHAALFAGQLASRYAPELDLLGVVGSAPAAELSTLLRSAVPITPAFGLVASAVYAYGSVYDDLDLAEALTPAALERIDVVEQQCLQGVTEAFSDQPPAAWLVANPVDLEAWERRIEENEPGSAAVSAPVLVVQGTNDFIVLASSTQTAIERMCAGGNTVDYREYPRTGHGDILVQSGPDVLAWVAERVAGVDARSSCDA
ncbi:MAG TPA: alpha/beta fold hydrolase [Acidimicrobiales bacterium]|nr:alpha/beta fold hydrolase [Acidimicrobiales bacterium]